MRSGRASLDATDMECVHQPCTMAVIETNHSRGIELSQVGSCWLRNLVSSVPLPTRYLGMEPPDSTSTGSHDCAQPEAELA